MREQILRLATATVEGPSGTFAVIADGSSPDRFVQWIQVEAGLIRVEVPASDEASAAAAASLGYSDDVPNFAQEISGIPDQITDLALNTIEVVLGGVKPDDLQVTFERGEPAEDRRELSDARIETSADDPERVQNPPEHAAEPALLCFQRPDGRSGWAIARDPDDYVHRLEAGEYGSRSVPTGSQLTAVVRVDNPSFFPRLRDLLNRDRDLAAAASAVLEGALPTHEEGPAASIVTEVSSGFLAWDRVSAAVAEIEQRRAASRSRRKQPKLMLRGRVGDAEITRVLDVGFIVGAVARAGSTTWLHGYKRDVGPVLAALSDDGDLETWQVTHRARQLLLGPEDAVAVVGFNGAAITQGDGRLVTADAPTDVRVVGASRHGIVAALRDRTLICWSWDGSLRWRSAPLEARMLDLAVADKGIVVRADGRLMLVEDEGQVVRPAPRVPRKDRWDSVEVTAIGVRGNTVYAAMGSTYARLELGHGTRWTECQASQDFLGHTIQDASGQVVGFSGRSSATVFGLDGAATTIPTTRRVSGWLQQNATLSSRRMLIHGRTDSSADAADVFDLSEKRLTHQLAFPGRAEVVGAWAEEPDGFGLVGGSQIFSVVLRRPS